MDSRSSLRKRERLVWDIKRGSNFNVLSPNFYISNSKWYLKIHTYSCDKYIIYLMNVEGRFEPFEVETFIEDRRSNANIKCSRLTVSSACETLFFATFDSTYARLPGIKTYDDFSIICIFYPSTLALHSSKGTEKDPGPSFRIRQSLVWTVLKPDTSLEMSPVFGLQKLWWRFEMDVERNYDGKPGYPKYKLYLRNCSGTKSFEPFEIKTFLGERRNGLQIQCSRLIVSSSLELLCDTSLVDSQEKLEKILHYDDIMIVCTFGSFAEQSLVIKPEK